MQAARAGHRSAGRPLLPPRAPAGREAPLGAALCDACLFPDHAEALSGRGRGRRCRCSAVALSHLGMVWVGLSFGLWNIVAETVLNQGVPAIVFGTIRALGATPLLFVLAMATEDCPTPAQIGGRDALQLIALGFTNGIGDTGTFLIGLQLTTPDVAAISAPLSPIVCCVMAVLVRLEIINGPKAIGIVLGVGGSAVMLNLGGQGQQHAENMSLGLVVLAGGLFCGAAAVLQQKPLYTRFGVSTESDMLWVPELFGSIWPGFRGFTSNGPPTTI